MALGAPGSLALTDQAWTDRPTHEEFSEFGKSQFFQMLGLGSEDIGVRLKMVGSMGSREPLLQKTDPAR